MTLPRVRLELVALRHEAVFLAAVRRSRALHRPWGAPPATAQQFRRYVKASSGDAQRAYLMFNAEAELVGVATVSQVVRGLFRSAYLGYFAFVPHAGHGYLSSGLAAVIRAAFGKLQLHRLEANIQPGNARSIALVKRLGFRLEGYSEKYLKIGGQWRDHERWAITKDHMRPKTKTKTKTKTTTTTDYLAALPPEQRAALEKLRKAILAAAPRAEECISYQLPAFRLDGKMLVWFGATKKHCAFYPGAVVQALADELSEYETSKGTIRFQPDHPLPAALVRKLVKARIAALRG
jgi:ribosomal-protein-alanine N-acetyltransferase